MLFSYLGQNFMTTLSSRLLKNIFSNWATLVTTIVLAFFVSPILVNQLGAEMYGTWVLIVSLTGFFTVLDFGINSAVVRYVSKYYEEGDQRSLSQIVASALCLFTLVALVFLLFALVFFSDFIALFNLSELSKDIVKTAFVIIVIDLAINLIFGVFQATLCGLHQFLKVNAISITINIVKNAVIVYLLYQGHSILTLAIIQLCATLATYSAQVFVVVKQQRVQLSYAHVNRKSIGLICNYSVYSFLIAIAAKLLFYSDSVVISSVLEVSKVTFYAIPVMLCQYLEKLVWAIIAVLVPIISGNDSEEGQGKNKQMYGVATRYVLILCCPVFVVLFSSGESFLSLWMGNNFGDKTEGVFMVLLFGYIFYLAQLPSHGILKGLSKHNFLAYMMLTEAVVNLVLSITLAKYYGIWGVAVGTVIPLFISNLIVLPWWTCRLLNISYFGYLYQNILKPLSIGVLVLISYQLVSLEVSGFIALIVNATATLLASVLLSTVIMERHHLDLIIKRFRKKTCGTVQ